MQKPVAIPQLDVIWFYFVDQARPVGKSVFLNHPSSEASPLGTVLTVCPLTNIYWVPSMCQTEEMHNGEEKDKVFGFSEFISSGENKQKTIKDVGEM